MLRTQDAHEQETRDHEIPGRPSGVGEADDPLPPPGLGRRVFVGESDWTPAELGMPLPPPVTPWERDKAGWVELSGLIGMSAAAVFSAFTLGLLGLATWIAPFVFHLVYRNRSPFVRYHAAQALNVQLTSMIVGLGAVLLSLATLGLAAVLAIPLAVIFWVAQFVFVIIATSRAEAGEWYAIPAFLAWPMVH
ncbi:DUF4870 domain-containing protein [Actinomadura logoneensis]|uniref:DUF4870 domain-containing protein n=1 Tax=Actinomadura logoneensis TaxID=2293572 RepID=UPI001314858B|nr:DUF4870 domain-containing protein [Actinomadura logoneensis]